MSVDAIEGGEEGGCDVVSLETEQNEGIWGSRVQKLANYLIRPFWFCEKKIHSYIVLPLHSKEHEKSYRKVQRIFERIIKGFFMTISMLAVLPFSICGMCLTQIGNMMQTNRCHHVVGKYRGPFSAQPRIFFLNSCMLPGGLPYSCGGISPAEERFDHLIKTICENNPDFVFLSEFNRTLDREMAEKLTEHYNHFVIDIGLNSKGLESGFFIAYRGNLTTFPCFIPFEKRQVGVYSGFIMIETPDSYFICTHFDRKEGGEVQCAQTDQIFRFIETQCKGKRVVLMGSLYFERGTEQHKKFLDKGFIDKIKKDQETCTNALKIHQGDPDTRVVSQSIDYMLFLDQGDKKFEVHLLPTYDQEGHDFQALSDHKALIGTIK